MRYSFFILFLLNSSYNTSNSFTIKNKLLYQVITPTGKQIKLFTNKPSKNNYETIDSDGKSNIWASEPKITFVSFNKNQLANQNSWALILITIASISFILLYLQAMTPELINY